MNEERPASKGSVLKDVAWVEQDNMDLKGKETTLNFNHAALKGYQNLSVSKFHSQGIRTSLKAGLAGSIYPCIIHSEN